ncbi:MAG: hypothetical protein K2M86_07345, partial [Odoribacter sp.]|nr:hypothetical protein [Odoribacter sp.]
KIDSDVSTGMDFVGSLKNVLVFGVLQNNKRLCEENKLIKAKTTGVCADDNYVYLATEIGLQVYDWVGDTFHRYAFEAASYNGANPASEESPEAGTTENNSPNFVAVNPTTGYIYVAYG